MAPARRLPLHLGTQHSPRVGGQAGGQVCPAWGKEGTRCILRLRWLKERHIFLQGSLAIWIALYLMTPALPASGCLSLLQGEDSEGPGEPAQIGTGACGWPRGRPTSDTLLPLPGGALMSLMAHFRSSGSRKKARFAAAAVAKWKQTSVQAVKVIHPLPWHLHGKDWSKIKGQSVRN